MSYLIHHRSDHNSTHTHGLISDHSRTLVERCERTPVHGERDLETDCSHSVLPENRHLYVYPSHPSPPTLTCCIQQPSPRAIVASSSQRSRSKEPSRVYPREYSSREGDHRRERERSECHQSLILRVPCSSWTPWRSTTRRRLLYPFRASRKK